jgi:hypothetical protein
MTALAKDRQGAHEKWGYHLFTLVSGTIAFKNGAAGLDCATGKVRPMRAGDSDLLFIGWFDRAVDATAADKPVQVRFPREIHVEWFENSTAGDAIAATDVGKIVYLADDQTVALTPGTGRSAAGRVWAVSSTDGVAVEPMASVLASPLPLVAPADLGPFAANDLVVPVTLPQDAILDIPLTAGASTVTLPAAAPDGTRWTFVADGTKNGHTVQYRDATGPTVITAALTALKRHEVVCVKRDGKWFAISGVSP